MKKIFGIIFLMVGIVGSASAADVNASSRISQVTVYASSAFVTRSATVPMKSGDTRVVFANIVPELDENSLRVKGRGTAEVKLLGAQLKREYTADVPVEKVQQLTEEIQALEDHNTKLENEKQVLDEEKKYLDSIRLFSDKKIPEDLVTKMPSAQELEATRVFLNTKLGDNLASRQEIDIAIRKNQKTIEALRRELEQVAGPAQKMKRSIIVEVEVVREGDFDLDVSYGVSGASWSALYDARASFEKSQVELVSYGIVRQNTGEDWENVEMVLSTAQVTGSGNMPEVNSWFIHPYQPPMPAQAYGGNMKAKAPRASLRRSEMAGNAPIEADALMSVAPAAEAVNVYAQAELKGVSVAYKLSRKVTVKSDGEEHKLPVSAQTLAANFEYSAYPRATVMAYLRSRVTSAKDLQLLGGRVNVFVEGDFVGTSSIASIAPGQEFDLYMGMDENVKIKRELLERKKDDQLIGGIPSPSMKETYKYKLTVENYKAAVSRVNLFEVIPVSEDERIKVKVSQTSVEPKEKEWKDRKGVWRWELQLEPKAKQEVFYTCVVEYPRGMRVEGLD